MITRITYRQELPDGSDFVNVRESAAEVGLALDNAKAAGLATINVTGTRSGKLIVIPVDLVGPIEDRR